MIKERVTELRDKIYQIELDKISPNSNVIISNQKHMSLKFECLTNSKHTAVNGKMERLGDVNILEFQHV